MPEEYQWLPIFTRKDQEEIFGIGNGAKLFDRGKEMSRKERLTKLIDFLAEASYEHGYHQAAYDDGSHLSAAIAHDEDNIKMYREAIDSILITLEGII